MRLTPTLSLLALGIPIFGQAAKEDDLLSSIMDTVVVASKTAESVNAAPGIITVVNRKEIEGFAAKNLGQIMSRVVGMSLLSPDIFADQSVVIRGQENTPYNNHILVLLNGRPLRDPISGGLNGATWNAFPVDVIDHLEIIRGPGSVLYGSCAYSGVVNIVTKVVKDKGISGGLILSGGAFGGFGQQASLSINQGDFQGLIGLEQYADKGPNFAFTDYKDNDGNRISGAADFNRHTVGVVSNLSYKGFTLNFSQNSFQTYALNGGSEKWDPNNLQRQRLSQADLGYSKTLNPVITLGANITYNKMQWLTEPNIRPKKTLGEAYLYEGTVQIHPVKDLNVVLGGGYEKSSCNGEGLLVKADQKSTFLYAQADYRIQAVKLIGGAQYNKLENIDSNVSPRLGAVVDFTPELGAKVLYSTAFRKGYPLETGFNHPFFRGNLDLKPELITTTEVQFFYQGKKASANLTFYTSKTKDTIIRLPHFPVPGGDPDYLKYYNVDAGQSWKYSGVELEGKYNVTNSLLVTGSVSNQANENPDGLKNAALHPNTLVKLGLLYSESNWSLGLFNNYRSEPHPTTLAGASVANNVNPAAEAVSWMTLRAMWKPLEKGTQSLSFVLDCDNLLDKDIRYPDYPNKGVNTLLPLSAGRSVALGATYRF